MGTTESLLNHLTDNDIREIYIDGLLRKDGYQPYYIIDADEVADYCHPLAKNEAKSLGEIADEQFIIEYLFESEREKILITNDYFDELVGTRLFLVSKLNLEMLKQTVKRYRNDLVDLIEEMDLVKSKDNSSYTRKILENYSFLLSFSTGSYKNKLSKFNNLMGASSANFEGRLKDPELEWYLQSYLRDEIQWKKIYDDFRFQTVSKLNDINALLKAYHLTNRFQDDNHKKIFYFLSSSTTDIQNLRTKILNKEINNPNLLVGKLPDRSFTLIRSKRQLFASLIYETFEQKNNGSEDKNIEYEQFKEILITLKKEFNDKYLDDRRQTLTQNQNQTKEIIENLMILRKSQKELLKDKDDESEEIQIQIQELDKVLKVAVNDTDNRLLKDRFDSFLRKVDLAIDEEFGDKNNVVFRYAEIQQLMRSSIFEMEVVDDFLNKLLPEKRQSNEEDVEFDRGSDTIEGVFNAFPLLFEYDFYKTNVYSFLKKIRNERKFNKNLLREYTDNVDVVKDSKQNVFPFILYLFMIVEYEDPKKRYSSNFFVYTKARKIIEEYVSYKDFLTKNLISNNRFLDSRKKEMADIYAIGCWAARRSRKYKFAYDLSRKAKAEFPNDPRFDFSLALIGYCWKYEVVKEKRYEWSYQSFFNNEDKDEESSILSHCEAAIKKFRNIEGYKNKDFIKSSYIALLNHTSFSYAAKYKSVIDKVNRIDKNEAKRHLNKPRIQYYLERSRDLVDEIKSLLEIVNQKTKSEKLKAFPEFIHTEVFLEYYEIKNSIYCKDEIPEVMNYKVNKAINDIQVAIKYCRDKRIGLGWRCKSLLEKLRNV